MAESRFKKYKQILQDEAKKARSGEESKVFNAGNITASVLFIGCICVWSVYFIVKPASKPTEFKDPSKVLKIVFFDVGQGDSALLIIPQVVPSSAPASAAAPSKKIVLIDAGGKPGYIIEESEGTSEEKEDAAKNVIIPYLTRELFPRSTAYNFPFFIDYFIATHPHSDHYGGFVTLIENKIIPKMVYDVGYPKAYPLYETFLGMIKEAGAKYRVPAVGETADLGGGVFMKFMGPVGRYRGTKSDENNSSMVVKIVYGKISLIFTGDVELESENDLLSWRGELKSTVLKVAHHGSGTSTTAPFLDRVAPEIAVISAGTGNPFGHPSEETIKKLTDRNISIYRTDQNGTVTMLTDGNSLEITAEK